MAFNALRYSYLPREPDKFDVGPMIDRFRQGEADGNARRVRNALGTAGSMAASGDMTGASNELLGQGELDAGFGIQDRQRAIGERAQKAKIDASNQDWQRQERARQQTSWGRQDTEWGQGQQAVADARKAKAAGLYANLYRIAGGDQAKLKQLEDVARAGGFEIPAEFSQPGGEEVAQAIAGGGQEPMTQYQQQQIEIEKQKLAQTNGVGLEQGKFEQGLRKERSAIAGDFRTISDGYGRIEAGTADNSGTGDIAIVYGYMKMLDPGSVVREGEFATAENTSGVPAQIANTYNKIINGERLPPGTREQFVGMAKRLYAQKQSELQAVDERFGGIADRYNIPRDNVLLPLGVQPGAGAGSDAEDLSQIPEGAVFRDNQTGQVMRMQGGKPVPVQ